MVAFGNAILAAQRPGWERAYVDYQDLKDLIFRDDPKAFYAKLQLEIEKVSLFALHRQGEIARTLGTLRLPHELPLFSPSEAVRSLTAAQTLHTPRSSADAFTQCAVELLHWQRFVCINAVGIRKIIKKFQKHHANWRDMVRMQDDTSDRENNSVKGAIITDDPHLQQLVNSASVAAMSASLAQACKELDPEQRFISSKLSSYQHARDERVDTELGQRYAWIRLHCTVVLIGAMRNYAKSMNESFYAFLSNRSMIEGQPLLTSSDETSLQALRIFLHLQPDSLLTMDASRMGRVWEDYGFLETSFRIQSGKDREWGGVDSVSLMLNLSSTLLYTVRAFHRVTCDGCHLHFTR